MRRTRGTGSIIKLKWYEKDGTRVSRKTPGAVKCESAYWYILYRGQDGVQRRQATGTESKTKAENLLIERLGEIRRGFTPAQDLKSLYYEDIRDAYLRDKPDQQKNYHLRPLNAFFAGMRVAHITTGTIRDFIDERREEVEDPTIRRDLIPLRAMFSLAVKEKAINESDKPYFPRPKSFRSGR